MIAVHTEIILIVTGILTASAVLQLFAPRVMVRRNFGDELSGDAATFLAAHWGLIVFCVGGLLVYAAYHPELRAPVMIAAGAEKIGLVAMILTGPLRRKPQALFIAVADSVMTLLYAGCLLGW